MTNNESAGPTGAFCLAKAFKPESAPKGDFSAAFGSLSSIGVSLMGFASPKSTQKSAPLGSQNFVSYGFFGVRGKNTGNPNGLPSILTKSQHKIRIPKSGSGLNALARKW